jgi:putative transposase
MPGEPESFSFKLKKKTSNVKIMRVCQPHTKRRRIQLDKNTLSHTTWECKYHIIFAPKYRRQIIYGKIKNDIGKILRDLCERKGIEIIEAELCKDHVHMLVRIPPKYSVSEIMGYLKGKSSLMIFDRHANLKYKYGNRNFWCRGYYVDTVGKNAKKIEEYIRNQLQEDITNDQISLKEYMDPFTGEQVKKSK